jgi:CheY-specific phosphatase CheX
MSSTNLPTALPTDPNALDRALAMVAEESFFAMVDPVMSAVPAIEGSMLSARVTFTGSFSGTLTCRMSRSLAEELIAAFTGEEAPFDATAVNDLAGEFANMVCGRWLTDVAPSSLFHLEHPVVASVSARELASSVPTGLLNGQPIWVALSVEG